jgi:HPt (histidine-containing phosphotransfer) domain-containing protein
MTSLSKSSAVTDREIALRRLGGNETLLRTLAGFFLEDAPTIMQQLDEARQAGHLSLVALRAHSLKGLSSTFEAVPFQEVAAEIESRAKASDQSFVDQSFPQLQQEFGRLVVELRALAH